MKAHLVRYGEYNLWANRLICDFIVKHVTDEMMDREIISSFSSLRKTLFHIWDAEYLWYERLNGTSHTSWPSKKFTGTSVAAMQQLLQQSEKLSGFISSRDDAFFLQDLGYSRVNGEKYVHPVTDVLQHVVNHSTYHRGQIITMLRQLGFTELFSTDYVSFCR